MRLYNSNLFLIIATLFFRCSMDIAGGPGSGSETTNSLTITVVYSDGKPASGAIVRLRSAGYLCNPENEENDSLMKINTNTDSSGTVILSNIDLGEYAIEVNDSNGHATLITYSVTLVTGDTVLPIEVLKETSDITGIVDTSIDMSSIIVQIYGIERIAEVDSVTGQFTLYDIPEGDYTLRISDTQDPQTVAEVSGIITSDKPVEPVIIQFLWPYTQHINLNTTENGAAITETVTDFPVLIKLDSVNFDFRITMAEPKIRFTSIYGDTFHYQIEMWDSVSQSAVLWVRVDTIHSNDKTTIVMLTGKNDAPDISDSKAVFDTGNGFQAVWHLGESGEASVLDATVNSYTGTPHNIAVTDGVIGSGFRFNGSSYIEILNSFGGALNFSENGYFTLSAWVKTDLLDTNYQDIISKGNFQYGLQITRYSLWNFFKLKDRVGWACTDAAANAKSWHYITGVSSGIDQYLYVNGVMVDSTVAIREETLLFNAFYNVMIGRRSDVEDRWFKGVMDEVCISNKARSAAWIKLCYENQRIDQKFVQLIGK